MRDGTDGHYQVHYLPHLRYRIFIEARLKEMVWRASIFRPEAPKGDSAFPWISAQPPLEPHIEYAHNILHVILRAIPAIHETNALRDVL